MKWVLIPNISRVANVLSILALFNQAACFNSKRTNFIKTTIFFTVCHERTGATIHVRARAARSVRACSRETCDLRRGRTTELLFAFSVHQALEKLRVSLLAFFVRCSVYPEIFMLGSGVNLVRGLPRTKDVRFAKGRVSRRIAHEFELLVCPRDAIFQFLGFTALPAFQPISE